MSGTGRGYAQVQLSIWNDDAFRDLPVAAQHLYFVLLTSPGLTYAGTDDWHPGRIAARAAGWTAEQVESAAAVLIHKLYLVVDRDTGEFLIRSFIRNDHLMKQRNLGASMAMARARVASRGIRGVIVHELKRLKDDQPDLAGFKPDSVSEAMDNPAIDPASYPCGDPWIDPGPDPAADPTVKGQADPTVDPYVDPQVKGQVGGQPLGKAGPRPYNSTFTYNLSPSPSPEGGEVVREVTGGARDSEPPSLIPDEWLDRPSLARCPEHVGMTSAPACWKCRDAKHAATAAAQDRHRAENARIAAGAAARLACDMCDDTGQIVGDNGAPLAPAITCTHDEDANAGLVLAARERIEAQEAEEAERRAIAAKAAAEARARWKRDPHPEPQEVPSGPF